MTSWMTQEIAEVQAALAQLEEKVLIPGWQRAKGAGYMGGGSGAGSGAGHQMVVAKKCHSDVGVITLPDITLCLDAWSWVEHLVKKGEVDVGVKLTGPVYSASSATLSGASELVKALRPFVTAPVAAPVLGVDWPDMGVPPLAPEFWGALASHLKGKRVGIGCGAGHGRTGTAAAAILVSLYKTTTDEAINFLRREYCKEVVETAGQIALVRAAEAAPGVRLPWPKGMEKGDPTPVKETKVPHTGGATHGGIYYGTGGYQWPHQGEVG